MPTMISIPAGSFWMGTDKHFECERPRHRVFVNAFEMAATTVTRREYNAFLEAAAWEKPKGWDEEMFSAPDQPVVGVNWFDAVAYCKWLGDGFRLPTEAEWERACRGGLEDMEYAWGQEPPESIEYFSGEWIGPRPVAAWSANAFGLFNIGDNVHEWCQDWYAADFYIQSPERNPSGPESGARRVSRGGSWRHLVKAARAAQRSSLPPEYRYTDYGFRVARG